MLEEHVKHTSNDESLKMRKEGERRALLEAQKKAMHEAFKYKVE